MFIQDLIETPVDVAKEMGEGSGWDFLGNEIWLKVENKEEPLTGVLRSTIDLKWSRTRFPKHKLAAFRNLLGMNRPGRMSRHYRWTDDPGYMVQTPSEMKEVPLHRILGYLTIICSQDQDDSGRTSKEMQEMIKTIEAEGTQSLFTNYPNLIQRLEVFGGLYDWAVNQLPAHASV